MVTGWLQEWRLSLRRIARRPRGAWLLILVLAIGIGANVTVFCAFERLLLRPLPYPDDAQLVVISNHYPAAPGTNAGNTVADYLDRREQVSALADSALYYDASFDLVDATGSMPQRLSGVVATPSLFSTLAVRAQLGRTFTAADAVPEGDLSVMWVKAQPVVILSDSLWRSRFASDPNIIGQTLVLNGRAHQVLAVMPPSFAFPRSDVQVWLPFAFSDRQKSDAMRGFEFAQSVARLAPGATVAQLNAQLDTVAANNAQRAARAGMIDPDGFWARTKNTGFTARAVPLRDHLLGRAAQWVTLLLAAVALLLAIACANAINLVSIRVAERMRELALCRMLGASAWQVFRPLLFENANLIAIATVGGLCLAYASIRVLHWLAPDGQRVGAELALNGTVLLFAFGCLIFTSIVCTVVPAKQIAQTSHVKHGQDASRGQLGSQAARKSRNRTVMVQVALMVLLASASLLLAQSLWKLQQVQPGFSAEGVVSINMNLTRDRYRDVAAIRQFQTELLARIRAVPGVRAAGLMSGLPFSADHDTTSYTIDQRATADAQAFFQIVDTDLFRTLSIPLLAGRAFSANDDERATPVAIIDAALAERAFGQQSAVGQRIATPGVNGLVWREIVGVVGRIKRHDLGEQIDPSTLYIPNAQSPTRIMRLVVASDLPADSWINVVPAIVTSLDPEQPVWGVMPLQARVAQSMQEARSALLLVGLFASLAIMLCAIGLYAALSMTVNERTSEIGLRVAVGASAAQIVALVLREGAGLAIRGAVLGLLLALLLAAALRSLLFGFTAFDAALIGLLSLAALVIVLASAVPPALRAAKLDPMTAIRS